MNVFVVVLLFIGGVVLTVGDVLMKKLVVTNSGFFYLLGLAAYLLGLNFLAQSFRFENIAVASIMLVIFNVTILSLVSWFFFKEPLSVLQIIGIVLGMAAVTILIFAEAK